MDSVVAMRDQMQTLADDQARQFSVFNAFESDGTWSQRKTLAAVLRAWDILDSEVARLANEEVSSEQG